MGEYSENEAMPQHDAATRQDQAQQANPWSTARESGRALFGPDLILPGPSAWPFGQRARERRAERRAVRERATQRRAGLRRAWLEGQRSSAAGRPGRWAPVEPRRHVAVIACMAAVVVGLGALSWWTTSEPGPAPTPGSTPVAAPSPSPDPASSSSPDKSGDRLRLDPVEPIPPDGVAPIVPDSRADTSRDPQQVHTVPPPAAESSAAALSSPEAAAAGWMAQWCPFDYHAEFGAAESRARPWMTEHGWDTFDPHGNPRAESSWQRTVSADESAQCSRPQARVVLEAPRTAGSAIVQVNADRVVTGREGKYVEPLSQQRILQRDPDGLWRVDAATHGG